MSVDSTPKPVSVVFLDMDRVLVDRTIPTVDPSALHGNGTRLKESA